MGPHVGRRVGEQLGPRASRPARPAPSAMKSFSDGAVELGPPGRGGAGRGRESPKRTPTRGASPSPSRTRRTAGGRGRKRARDAVHSGAHGASADPAHQVVERLADAAGAERREPAARAGRGRLPRQRAEVASASRSSSTRRLVGVAPSKASRVASRTLRNPWCSKPVAGRVWRTAWCSPAVHLNGVSRSRAASIQAARVGADGKRCGLEPAGAELQVVLGLGDRVGRGQPVGGRLRLRELDVHRGSSSRPPASRAASTAVVIRRTLPAMSSRSRTAVSRPTTRCRLRRRGAARRRPPRAAGEHDRDRDRSSTSGSSGR